ncbi:hypothetical protein [Bordetella sp. N]|uniref:hypothetical protein n=1 Tax=Bordetella sp. N TaxID=1746199 RepID=UPI0012E3C46E|nr:hypothetical protein [Bordetella sp. N]
MELIIRGLEARKAWSRAAQLADPRQRLDAEDTALDIAYEQGDRDFWNGWAATEIPLLLTDIPALARCWEYGWELGQASQAAPWHAGDEDVNGEAF